jgi:hypothetical protein
MNSAVLLRPEVAINLPFSQISHTSQMAVATRDSLLATKILPRVILCIVAEFTISNRDLLLYLPTMTKRGHEPAYPWTLHDEFALESEKHMHIVFNRSFTAIFARCYDETVLINHDDDGMGPSGSHDWREGVWVDKFDDPIETLLTKVYKPCNFFEEGANRTRLVAAQLICECRSHLLK